VSNTLQTKERNEALQERCVGVVLLLPSPFVARPRRWAGRYARFPSELKQFFDPIVQPHLERLQKGEIVMTCAFVPKIGFLRLTWRNGELWGVFINDLEYAKRRLRELREIEAAVRQGTIVKNPQGCGMWVFQPTVSILPLALKVFAPTNLREQQLESRRSPPWCDGANSLNSPEDCEKIVKPSSHWLTPAIPRAVRAPTRAARWRGG